MEHACCESEVHFCGNFPYWFHCRSIHRSHGTLPCDSVLPIFKQTQYLTTSISFLLFHKYYSGVIIFCQYRPVFLERYMIWTLSMWGFFSCSQISISSTDGCSPELFTVVVVRSLYHQHMVVPLSCSLWLCNLCSQHAAVSSSASCFDRALLKQCRATSNNSTVSLTLFV